LPITRFAGMLYELSYTKIVESEDFNLSSYEKIDDEYVVEQVVSPEQAILRRIIRRWRQLVNEAVVSIDKST
jgi:hypothetical protein